MAINVRLPEDLDKRLDALAADLHTSKNALLLQAAELLLERHAHQTDVAAGLDFIFAHDKNLLIRLEDA